MRSVLRRGEARRRRVGFGASLALLALALGPASTAGAVPGPALEEPRADLRKALSCDAASVGGETQPVLLVHGTTTNARETWGWNYQRVLPGLGFGVCVVDLPNRSMEDIQRSSEYVVHAIRSIHRRSGRKVSLIGHSQGTLQPRWAIRWWPDVRRAVRENVSLAGPHHGTAVADGACVAGECAAALWQMRPGSAFIAALNSGDETPGSVSVTSIYSDTDELVQPSSTAILDGASSISVQDLCPLRYVHHGGLLEDAAVFELVLDALTHPGPADPGRFDAATCRQTFMPGLGDPIGGNATLYGIGALTLAGTSMVDAEPPLRAYAGG